MKFCTAIVLAVMRVLGVRAGAANLNMDLEFLAMRPRATGATLAPGLNLQTFTLALGGPPASPILSTGDATRPYSVDGDTFTDFPSASQRSCNNQHNACAVIANGPASNNTAGITVAQCDTQQTNCLAVEKTAVSTAGVASHTSTSISTTSTSTTSTSTTSTSESTTIASVPSVPAPMAALQTVQSVNDEFFFICDL